MYLQKSMSFAPARTVLGVKLLTTSVNKANFATKRFLLSLIILLDNL